MHHWFFYCSVVCFSPFDWNFYPLARCCWVCWCFHCPDHPQTWGKLEANLGQTYSSFAQTFHNRTAVWYRLSPSCVFDYPYHHKQVHRPMIDLDHLDGQSGIQGHLIWHSGFSVGYHSTLCIPLFVCARNGNQTLPMILSHNVL